MFGMSGAILLLLGAVFVTAGVSKLASPDPFRNTLRKLVAPSLAGPMTVGIPMQELLLAMWLLSGVAPRHAAAVAVVVLLGFSSVLLRMWRKGLTGCGCFGEAADSAPTGLARNAILIALALGVVLPSDEVIGPWSGGAGEIVGRLTLVLGAACLWPCAVAAGQRRKFILGTGGLAR